MGLGWPVIPKSEGGNVTLNFNCCPVLAWGTAAIAVHVPKKTKKKNRTVGKKWKKLSRPIVPFRILSAGTFPTTV